MRKKESRIRRSLQTRQKIAELKVNRLSVHRTNMHIYASVISPDAKILVTASTLNRDLRENLSSKQIGGGNIEAARLVGKAIAEKAISMGLNQVAFDRSGFRYHGRIKALADAARAGGLKF